MDARIKAILASYDKHEDEETDEEEVKEPGPPQNLAEFIATKPVGLQEWPNFLDGDEELNLTVDSVGLGSLEDIMADLSTYAPFDESLLDDIQQQIDGIETRLFNYSSNIIREDQHSPSTLTGSRHLLNPTSIRALNMEHPDEVINKKENVKHRFGFTEEQSSAIKSIQHTTYPGFFPAEMTPLPGQLEAPQLLNNVIKAQNVLPAFSKVLKKLFLSEASVAILQDTFWWYFLNNFQNDSKAAQDGLFNRIADSFVALFFGVPTQYKDLFFTHYPDCLAQAVYAAFCHTFPRSYHLFDDDFRTNLLSIVSEWVTGTRPPPHSWKKWNLKILEPANIRELQDNRSVSLKVNMAFDIDAALDEVLPATAFTARTGKRPTIGPHMSASNLLFAKDTESHEIGPGPEFERVNFNIFGQSPLVSHYLKMKELTTGNGPVKAIGRTEIAKPQAPAPTYKQVLDETKKAVKTRSINYQKVLEASTHESSKIQKQKRNALRKIDKLKTDLVLKNQDIKIISEKLLDLMSQSDYASAGYATSNAMQPSLDDDDQD